ncbi:MAG TPA: deoxyribonuclease IV [Thermoplasmata archaeon]|nr:deoxyribonuclease IV [Thermoplasmata archaeon]
MYLGAHIGIADGLAESVRQARRIGCDAIQIFSKSPQMWAGPAIAPGPAEEFRTAIAHEGLKASAVHHGYLANLGSPKPEMLARSRAAFLDEMHRAELLGVDGLIFHPGAHLGSGTEAGLRTIAESLRGAIAEVPTGKARLLLENAAGQGTTLGATLEELAAVLEAVAAPARVGIALDTCHLFAAGFDFRTEEGYGSLVDRIESTIGARRVYAFHLNDAKAPPGSHLDRHENIGRGEIGTAGFRHFVNDPRWAMIPGYLETPIDENGYERYAEDLRTLRSLEEGGPPPKKARAKPARPARRRASAT